MIGAFQLVERTVVVAEIFCDGKIVELTPQQAAVARALIAAGGEYVSREDLMRILGSAAQPKLIEVLVCKLRRALEAHHHTAPIENAQGRGWRWVA